MPVPPDLVTTRVPQTGPGATTGDVRGALAGGFEEQLDRKVLLAFFIPAVVYTADAVGTQTEAVLIRGLSVGIDVRRVAVRELATVFQDLLSIVVYLAIATSVAI